MIVTVKQGQLKGTENTSVLTNKTYYSFLGIPYAKPALGNLRFRPPEPLEKWEGVLDATKEGNMCIQKDMLITKQILGSEDCLVLNVHTPQPPSEISTLKPVMVFIHGGAFSLGTGSSQFYSPDYLINHDVIFVSINYRVHVLGFLNLGLPECPGNVGLKDQLLALEWIKDNIKAFGGDPDNITLFGESAGAASVHYHIISPLSRRKDLFKRCILQSGSSLNIFALTDHPLESAFALGELFGYTGKDPKELLELLKKIPANELAETVEKLHEEMAKKCPARCINYQFIPSIELIKDGAMIPEHPKEMTKKAKPIPMICGLNDQEGLIAYARIPPEKHVESFNEQLSVFVQHNLGFPENVSKEVAAKLKKFYLDDKAVITIDNLPHITHIYSDVVIAKEFHESFEFAWESAPVYTYYFCYEGGLNIYKQLFASNLPVKIKGACHADELGYLFVGKLFPPAGFTEEDVKVINNLCILWTNYAKTGDPNGSNIKTKWLNATPEKPVYLEIDQDLELKDGKILNERISFWQDLLSRHITPKF